MELSAKTGVQRVRHEIRQRDITVTRIEQLAPDYLSITFSGEALEGFTSLSFDDHLKFILSNDEESRVWRDYTPRHFDPAKRELTLEFALHHDGAATDWARAATVGTSVTIAGPRGSMMIPTDYDWHLLAGDATALPAIRRRLAELPDSAKVIVIASGDDNASLLPLSSQFLQVHRVAGEEEMAAAVRALLVPAGLGYCWCAGEAAAMKQLRDVLSNEKQHPKNAMRIAAYWKQGVQMHHENLE
ncbi:siderophore-interacting protein [Pseudoduganella sp. UC29_106]|uniref:siderophore-interacting protein n=1 Tax=Pseudoduganella sp. UC29_106 TaxID=3374553 RepID=UPI0037570B3E